MEVRRINENGQVLVGIANGIESPETMSRAGSNSPSSTSGYATDWSDTDVDEDAEDYEDGEGEVRKAGNTWERADAPILLYLFQVGFCKVSVIFLSIAISDFLTSACKCWKAELWAFVSTGH